MKTKITENFTGVKAFPPMHEEVLALRRTNKDLLEAAKGAKEMLEELHAISGGSFDVHSSERYCALEAAIAKAEPKD